MLIFSQLQFNYARNTYDFYSWELFRYIQHFGDLVLLYSIRHIR